jgi:hypothetical protein
LKLLKGPKSENCHPNPLRYQKLNNLLRLLKNPREKKKRKRKVHPNAPSYQKTEHLLKTLKNPTTENCHPNPSSYQKLNNLLKLLFLLFWKNPTMIQPCAPKIPQPTQNLN